MPLHQVSYSLYDSLVRGRSLAVIDMIPIIHGAVAPSTKLYVCHEYNNNNNNNNNIFNMPIVLQDNPRLKQPRYLVTRYTLTTISVQRNINICVMVRSQVSGVLKQ